MKKLYLLLFAIAGFVMQAKAGVPLTHVSSTKPTGNENAPCLIDGDKTTKWGEGMNNGESKWVIFKATLSLKPTSYTMTIANDTNGQKGRNWQKWRIYGGNFASDAEATTEATGWVLLDFKSEVSEEDFPTGSQYQATDFTMSEPNDAYYQYFLIYVDEIRSSGQYMQMGEFAFKDYTVDTSTAQAYVNFDYTTDVDADLTAAYDEKLNTLNAAITANDPDQIVPAVEAIVPVYKKIVTFRNGGYLALEWSSAWGDGPGSNLVDKNDNTKWGGNFPEGEGTEHVQYIVFRTLSQQPFFYKLVTGGDTERWNTRNWKTWKVFGGNFVSEADAKRNASNGWVLLDQRTDITDEYLPNKNNYPATFDFSEGVSTKYSYYKVEVTASSGSQQQMSEMYLCSQAEFEEIRQPLIEELQEFADGLDTLVVEASLSDDKTTFTEKYETLKTTADAVALTKIYNELFALKEKLEKSAAFVAGDCYRVLDGNTAWGDGENWTKIADGNINTKWGGGMPDGGSYVIFNTYTANTFNQYMLVTGDDTKNNSGRNWKNWKIYGAEEQLARNDEGWTLIDQKENIGQDRLPADNFAPVYFSFTNPKNFQYFKIEVEAAYSGDAIQMSEFKFLSDAEYATIRQEYVDSLTKVSMGLAALEAEIDLSAEKKQQLMEQLTATITEKISAVATATADNLLSLFNNVLNYINVEVPAIVAQAQLPELVDGVYQLGRARDLANFAALVNAGENEAKAVLVADIDLSKVITNDAWTSIGTNDVPYKGTFDGQGYTISGITYTATGQYNGLFGKLSEGAVVKNFTAEGTMTVSTSVTGRAVALIAAAADANVLISNINSKMNYNNKLAGAQVGGILGGSLNGTITVDRCIYSGTLDGNDAGGSGNYGGIVGYVNNNSAANLSVTNCLFEGKLINTAATPGNCTFGGMVGYVGASPKAVIKNCLSIGTIQSAVTGQFFGAVKSNKCSIVNSFYQGTNVNGSASTVTLNPQEATLVTSEQLASSEVVLNLGIAWRQDLGTDAYPAPDATKPVVVKIGDAEYATLYVDNADITVPTGVKAFTAQIAEGKIEGGSDYQYLALSEVDGVIPAGTPVILKGAPATYEFTVPAAAIPDGALGIYGDEVDGSKALAREYAAPIENNVLKGTADEISAVGKYILAKPADQPVCFYKAETGTIKAGKAYLEIASDVKAFYFLFPGDDATGISTIDNGQLTMDNAVIYNVAGQRVSKMQKGINIVNGKKILK